MRAFDNSEFKKHRAEARDMWGKTEDYREHKEKTRDYSRQKWNDLAWEILAGLGRIYVADALSISDKTVPKWERGKGLPEISLMMPRLRENRHVQASCCEITCECKKAVTKR